MADFDEFYEISYNSLSSGHLYVQHITLMYFMYVSNISDDDDDEVIIVAIATLLVLSQFQGCG